MIQNYFKVAWRNLQRNRTLGVINIVGLSVGMAFALLIGLWIQFETSFDRFHSNLDRLGLIRKHTLFNNQKNSHVSVMLPLYDELKTAYPEVKRVTRVAWSNQHSLMVGDKKINRSSHYVDPDFLHMFSFPLISGNVQTALNDPNSVVLTESTATALFGTSDVIGKQIRLDNAHEVQVSAVMKDVPDNSTLEFDFLAPYEFRIQHFEFVRNAKTQWGNNHLMTMVELQEGVSMDAFSKKIGPLITRKDESLKNQTLFVQPFKDVHLRDRYKNWVNVGGRIEYVRLFGIIGVFVLLIACINFMNLTTARSEKRAREVGVRKAVGSPRSQLIMQFLCESVFTSFLAFLLALVIIQMILPLVADLGFQHISLDFSNPALMLGLLGVCIVTGLIAGSYPALYLSSFTPVKVLKGIIRQGRGAVAFRKVLVVSQFAISVGLIISTLIVFKQISHARNRQVGYDPNNLITIEASDDLARNYNALKTELMNTGYLAAVAKSSSPMTSIYNSWSDFTWDGKDATQDLAFDVVMTEWDYEKAAKLNFIAGRPFSRENKSDSSGVILNEAALRMIGYEDPIGKTIRLDSQVLTIVGVIENVVMADPFRSVGPGVILFDADQVGAILIRLKDGANLQAALAAMKPIVEKYNPSLPFDYSFVDEVFGRKFRIENQLAKLAGIFAALAILISCLGLFGLAMFMAERKAKEISIRKVLGASVSSLWMLLSKEFVWLVLVACVIASPLAFWIMKGWLEKYEYRIEIGWWVFAVAGFAALAIALFTVSTQAIRAAVANPAKSLKSE